MEFTKIVLIGGILLMVIGVFLPVAKTEQGIELSWVDAVDNDYNHEDYASNAISSLIASIIIGLIGLGILYVKNFNNYKKFGIILIFICGLLAIVASSFASVFVDSNNGAIEKSLSLEKGASFVLYGGLLSIFGSIDRGAKWLFSPPT